MGLTKNWFHVLWNTVRLMVGLAFYLVKKKTPPFAYQSMVQLFCYSKGYSNDFLSWVIGYMKQPYKFSNENGVLGNMMSKDSRGAVVSELHERGYYVFENRLPEELCERLMKYATTQLCSMRDMDENATGDSIRTIYHRGIPQATRYDFENQDLLENRDVQKILADMSFATVAQDYLESRPVIDVVTMWWHTAFSEKPDMEATQYHFDMDRPKWLKFFIYLTDVEATNGPHTFVAGSHKTGGIPPNLLRKGYARLMDEEVLAAYGKESIVEFVAPRGTIIAEDTRGLHKGKHVVQGDRLILQVQFSNSLFGAYYSKTRLGEDLCDELKITIEEFPELYEAYL
jgi:hypothetical protein